MRVLVAEDHLVLGTNLKKSFESCHYAVDLATNGEDALSLALSISYDILVLDVLLPQLNGFEICRQLRDHKRTMPILLLTALGDVNDRVEGLNLGADDYLVKPFAFRELEARVRALLRRESTTKSATLLFADITLDTATHEVKRGERLIALSSKEYALIEFLMRHPRQVLSRSMIAEHVWDMDAEHFSNVIDVYIRYLRNKLCEGGEADVIHTVRGSGYQLKEPKEKE